MIDKIFFIKTFTTGKEENQIIGFDGHIQPIGSGFHYCFYPLEKILSSCYVDDEYYKIIVDAKNNNSYKYKLVDNNKNNINPVKFETYKNFIEEIYNIFSMLSKNNFVFIGYGIKDFDINIIKENVEKYVENPDLTIFDNLKLIDLYEFSKKFFSYEELGNIKFKTVMFEILKRICKQKISDISKEYERSELAIQTLNKKHICKDLYYIMLKFFMNLSKSSTYDEINNFIKMPKLITHFTYGKYSGKEIREVVDNDMQYIGWVLKNLNGDTDLQYSINKILKEKEDEVTNV